MKKLLLVLGFLSIVGVGHATNADVTVGISSDYLYRGESVNDGDPTAFGQLKLTDAITPNVFIDASAVALNPFPINEGKRYRTDIGVGYRAFLGNVAVDVGGYRVLNPVLYNSDYNELRANISWQATDNLAVVSNLAHVVSKNPSTAQYRDSYAGLGLEYGGLFSDKLILSLLAATRRDAVSNEFGLNNVELGAKYEVLSRMYIFGTYSIGGRALHDAFDGDINLRGRDIPSLGSVGLTYSF